MWHIKQCVIEAKDLREETIGYAHKSFCQLTEDKIIIKERSTVCYNCLVFLYIAQSKVDCTKIYDRNYRTTQCIILKPP